MLEGLQSPSVIKLKCSSTQVTDIGHRRHMRTIPTHAYRELEQQPCGNSDLLVRKMRWELRALPTGRLIAQDTIYLVGRVSPYLDG
jgi:hypothetical protein